MRILFLLFVLPLAWAQFPAVCNTEDSLSTKTCCPNNCGTRGTCVSISASITASWESANSVIVGAVCDRTTPAFDVRCQWPLRVFDRVCFCNAGWGGYDCSRCDFGFMANGAGDCVPNTSQLLERQNFLELTMQKQLEYVMVINAAKNEAEEEKEWAVVVGEPSDMNGQFVLQNVSTYDMFVAHHFLSAREKDNDNCNETLPVQPDFAHEGSTFSTWHRYYLLIVERELRRVAERIGVSDFTLPYWDWTQGNRLFTQELFGVPEYCATPMDVGGNLFDMWPVVWDQHYRMKEATCDSVRALSDIENERAGNRPLNRGLTLEPQFLPKDDTIAIALAANNYIEDANYPDDSGFTKRLEGFVDLCTGANPCISTEGTSNNMHNAVHIFLGGHMSVVPSASNDPIFFLHHANIDRIFEAWLRKFNGNPPTYLPASGQHPGHNRNDSLIPFFPLKTNADMYKISSELGFRYNSLPWTIPDTDYNMCAPQDTCAKGGTSPSSPEVITCEGGTTSSPTSGGGGTTSRPTSGGGGTTSRPTSGGGGTSPDAGTTIFHVPLHLILVTGACAVLTVFKLFSI